MARGLWPSLRWSFWSYKRGARDAVVRACAEALVRSGCTLFSRLSRIQEGPRYLVSVAVLLTELLKLAACVVVILYRSRRGSSPARLVLSGLVDTTQLALPALLFTLQNQLNLYAATHLDAVAFQVTNQLKLLPTAVFSAMYLRRQLSLAQWLSLPALALGVGVVNSGPGGSDTKGADRFGPDWWSGLAAALTAAVLSGYAGVFCERLMKIPGTSVLLSRSPRPHASGSSSPLPSSSVAPPLRVPILTLNCALSAWGALFAGLQVVWGWLQGGAPPLAHFTAFAWAVVLLQALGGLLVSAVILYADNLVKGLAMARAGAHATRTQPRAHPRLVHRRVAQGVSIILTYVVSIPLFGLQPTLAFVLGLLLVVGSVVTFSSGSSAAHTMLRHPPSRQHASTEGARDQRQTRTALFAGVAIGTAAGVLWHSGGAGGLGWTAFSVEN